MEDSRSAVTGEATAVSGAGDGATLAGEVGVGGE